MLTLLLHIALAAHPGSALPAARFSERGSTEVDLLRVGEGGPRIYVQARLPDGSLALFLVDTGADISVLSTATAQRIGLEVEVGENTVGGLGGEARTGRATLPWIDLGLQGQTRVEEVELAVGVPGFQSSAGAMPLDGLLGNNVWSRFVLELDYPADKMVLHRPDSVKLKRRHTTTMHFDGGHVYAPLEVRTEQDPDTIHQITVHVDTGAGGLMFCGMGLGFTDDATKGLEMVLGLGASADLPMYRNLQMTRRIPLREVRLADQRVQIGSARWLNFDGSGSCMTGLVGLAGHELLANHRVTFDYGNGLLEMRKSRRRGRQLNGHRILLDQEVERNGQDPERAVFRARLHVWLGEVDEAVAALRSAADIDDEARVLLGVALREQGQLEESSQVLAQLRPGVLAEEGEIVATVNGLLLTEQPERALELAQTATEQAPEAPDAWIALSDALVDAARLQEAEEALRKGIDAGKNPDAFLLRRARVALISGDAHAAMAHARKQLQLYPMDGEALWFYALQAREEPMRATFLRDLERAMARLHPATQPLDFLVGAHALVGDTTRAGQLMEQGIERDCQRTRGASQDNCYAWYWALAGTRGEDALERIERALAHEERADYLDTLAMVRLARGEIAQAHQAAVAAARRSPDNMYMLWQADRLERMLDEED